jgi:hypothetical protein
MKFDILDFFENLRSKFKFDGNPTKITGTLHEDIFTFMVISRWFLLRMRNVSNNICRGNQNICVIFECCVVTLFYPKYSWNKFFCFFLFNVYHKCNNAVPEDDSKRVCSEYLETFYVLVRWKKFYCKRRKYQRAELFWTLVLYQSRCNRISLQREGVMSSNKKKY